MADTKISAMPAATTLAGSDVLPIVQGGTTKKTPASLLNVGAFIRLDANYTLTSTTAAQKIFDTTTNGRLTISETGLYEFDGEIFMSSMSTTSGNAKLNILGAGTATLAGQMFHVLGFDTNSPSTVSAFNGSFTLGANVTVSNMVSAGAGTSMVATFRGQFKVTAAGTLIPSVELITAAAAVVEAGTFFRVRKLAPDSVFTVGAWD